MFGQNFFRGENSFFISTLGSNQRNLNLKWVSTVSVVGTCLSNSYTGIDHRWSHNEDLKQCSRPFLTLARDYCVTGSNVSHAVV